MRSCPKRSSVGWRARHEARLSRAHFRVGAHLHRSGRPDDARPHLEEALRLRPESWNFRRQAIVLSDPALTGQVAATPELSLPKKPSVVILLCLSE